MNIYLQELRANRRSIIIWTISLCALAAFYLAIYPAFTKDIEAVKGIFNAYPPAVRAALGINLGNFFNVMGFYSFIFTYLLLAGAVQAMNLGVSLLSRELSGKTADFILTKPITRVQIMTEKLFAGLTALVITNVLYISVAFVTVKAVTTETVDNQAFLLISFTLFLVQLMFFSMGFLFSVVIPKIKSVVSVTLPTVFGFFIVGMMDALLGAEAIRYFTPFKFYDFVYVMKNGGYEVKFLAFEVALVVSAIVMSYVIFSKKDIHAVS